MTVLLERHEPSCNCSYCGNSYDKGLHFGLNVPADWWAHNAWYVVKFGPRRYFRWTNNWMPRRKGFAR